MMPGPRRYWEGINASDAPPRFVEYAYFAVTAYGVLAVALGLSVPGLAGGALAGLAAFCVLRAGHRAVTVYKPIAAPLGCAILFVVIQLAVHGESLQDTRPFVVWPLTLIVVHSLSLRQGFLRRFVRVASLLGLAVLPYLQYLDGGPGVERARLDTEMSLGGLSNSNDLAAWFGFCGIYFTVLGIESKRNGVRFLTWSAALICLYTLSLTVSRGTLIAFAIAAIVASRRLLKRGLIPALCLVILSAIIYEARVFESAAAMYVARGTEETGRLIVWPLALERFVSSPLAGVGISDVGIYDASEGHEITPHNSFLYVALASGVVPLLLFLIYWIGAARAAIRAKIGQTADAAFLLPLVLYALAQSLVGNVVFMAPWVIAVLSVAGTAGLRRHSYPLTRRAAEYGTRQRGVRQVVNASISQG